MKKHLTCSVLLLLFAWASVCVASFSYIVVSSNHIQVVANHIQTSPTTTTTTSTTTTTTTQPFNLVTADGYADPDPDCRGAYTNAGTFNGKPYYLRNDGVYRIYYYGISPQDWVIVRVAGGSGEAWWASSANPSSIYTGNFNSTGNPVFTAP